MTIGSQSRTILHCTLLLLIAAVAGCNTAGGPTSLPAAQNAYNRGDYASAYRIAQPLANQASGKNQDAAYVADIPDLEACSALGQTAEQALTEVEKAKGLWLEAAHAAGKPIPSPRYRPAIYQSR